MGDSSVQHTPKNRWFYSHAPSGCHNSRRQTFQVCGQWTQTRIQG